MFWSSSVITLILGRRAQHSAAIPDDLKETPIVTFIVELTRCDGLSHKAGLPPGQSLQFPHSTFAKRCAESRFTLTSQLVILTKDVI